MSKNLRNVAIPGTGMPLSLYCSFKAMTYFFILVVNPVLCLMAAINLQRKHGRYMTILCTHAVSRPFCFGRVLPKVRSLVCSGPCVQDTVQSVRPLVSCVCNNGGLYPRDDFLFGWSSWSPSLILRNAPARSLT